jgi:hypothetical protein
MNIDFLTNIGILNKIYLSFFIIGTKIGNIKLFFAHC